MSARTASSASKRVQASASTSRRRPARESVARADALDEQGKALFVMRRPARRGNGADDRLKVPQVAGALAGVRERGCLGHAPEIARLEDSG